jgi:hypothetical protein
VKPEQGSDRERRALPYDTPEEAGWKREVFIKSAGCITFQAISRLMAVHWLRTAVRMSVMALGRPFASECKRHTDQCSRVSLEAIC